jgi:hypothetical protein
MLFSDSHWVSKTFSAGEAMVNSMDLGVKLPTVFPPDTLLAYCRSPHRELHLHTPVSSSVKWGGSHASLWGSWKGECCSVTMWKHMSGTKQTQVIEMLAAIGDIMEV